MSKHTEYLKQRINTLNERPGDGWAGWMEEMFMDANKKEAVLLSEILYKVQQYEKLMTKIKVA